MCRCAVVCGSAASHLKLELGQGRFALRAFSNRRFLRVVPPAANEYTDVWTLEVSARQIR